MMEHTMAGWGAMSGFAWVFMALFWTLIILGVAALAKWLFSASHPADHADRGPLEVLKDRRSS